MVPIIGRNELAAHLTSVGAEEDERIDVEICVGLAAKQITN
jgi:hypothetical protein